MNFLIYSVFPFSNQWPLKSVTEEKMLLSLFAIFSQFGKFSKPIKLKTLFLHLPCLSYQALTIFACECVYDFLSVLWWFWLYLPVFLSIFLFFFLSFFLFTFCSFKFCFFCSLIQNSYLLILLSSEKFYTAAA